MAIRHLLRLAFILVHNGSPVASNVQYDAVYNLIIAYV
jgi:hypothetical protein